MLVLSVDSNKVLDSKRVSSLEDAIRALPDYIKLLLPQHLLNKIGLKVVTADGKSPKEVDLILNKNCINSSENNEKQDEETSGGGSGEKTEETNCSGDETNKLNHGTYEGDNQVESLNPVDGELCPDNNANCTITEADSKEESPMKAGVEYANILRVMAGLNEEIRALRERVTAANSELDQLRHVRDELLAARDAAPDEHVAGLRAALGDLQAQLTRSTVSEEANLAEIKRLATSAAEMQAELAFRPSRADVDDLTAVVGSLRADLLAKDALLERLLARDSERAGVDKAVETAPPDESMDTGHITAQIDEMFHLDYDDDESDSTAIETNDAEPAAERARLDDDERVQAHLRNGSLLALQEELVRAKEGWAAAADERARLDDDERVQAHLRNGSLLALQEELVRAKEGWAAAADERARLDDDERVQAHLRNGSLLALQEELVRAKEGWAAAADERARLDDDERVQAHLRNGSLLALQEELVRAKEGWAAAADERARLDDDERVQAHLRNGSLLALQEELVRAKEGWAAAADERARLDDDERVQAHLRNGSLLALQEELVRAKEGWAAAADERARLDDDERVQAHLRNGSLLALQEELVRAKEGWAAAADERARLAARLARLQAAPRPCARAALALAVLLAALYVALAPHLA
ncbi:uncharacterized protein LOC126975927 [Leptidea sinapis]|uniref:uncharacterized protein LOC126975927 n=1 Tax=Leptidea sinapis TaxID=189913 RepID=UPI0021C39AAF|nr:uncharacterized protein LOC126975927 [Leptidea sinapis]